MTFELKEHLLDSGKFQAYAWPGGYPIYYVAADSGILCPKCCDENKDRITGVDADFQNDDQWRLVGAEINYESTDLCCDNCSKRIESAYGDDD